MKWIRDLWGRITQKKAMKPEVRNMLLKLDGVYEQRHPESAKDSVEPTQQPRRSD